ncbi:MAG: hypothetical protein Kilf2KO_03990 [Rhodospirillales bacterium]
MDIACGREVVDLHVFLQDWLTGVLPRDVASFARFEGVIGEAFLVISPRGSVTERPALLTEFEANHGALTARADDFRIWVENYRCLHQLGDRALVLYEEWHRLGEETSARLTTALFERAPDRPNGVAWLHVHETWLPGHAPKAGERYPEPTAD